jgi:4-hydroxybenzoate polyprenyltransferase
MRDRVRAWLDFLAVDHPHLSPTVLQPVVLVLGLAEVPPFRHLLEDIIE